MTQVVLERVLTFVKQRGVSGSREAVVTDGGHENTSHLGEGTARGKLVAVPACAQQEHREGAGQPHCGNAIAPPIPHAIFYVHQHCEGEHRAGCPHPPVEVEIRMFHKTLFLVFFLELISPCTTGHHFNSFPWLTGLEVANEALGYK